MQNQRPNQVLDNVYGDKTLNNWLNPAAFAQPDLGTHGNVKRNAYEGPGSRVIDLSLVRGFEFSNTPDRSARRGVQRAQLVPVGEPEHDPEQRELRPHSQRRTIRE